MRYVLDASVLLKMVIEEQYSEEAVGLLSDPAAVFYAPDIVYYEIAGSLYKMVRRGIIEKDYALRAYWSLLDIPVETRRGDSRSLPGHTGDLVEGGTAFLRLPLVLPSFHPIAGSWKLQAGNARQGALPTHDCPVTSFPGAMMRLF